MVAGTGGSVFDTWSSSYWLVVLVKAGLVIGFYLTAFLIVSYMEHKVLAHMQHRIGPMYAGRLHGWAQIIADGVKFAQKDDFAPAAADRWVFTIAPGVVLVPYIVTLVVIPFSGEIFALNLDVGIFFVLARARLA